MKLSEKDFRIGNYIHYHIEDEMDERKEYDVLEQIDYDDLRCLTTYEDNSEYRPIPLSEEWLMKFGFEKRGFAKLLGELFPRFVIGWMGFYTIDNKVYIFGAGGRDLCEIQYVHQLQNLYFALTGEELILKT